MLCIFSHDLGCIPYTLVLGGKPPLLRATWVWPLMSALQNRDVQRQVCQFDSHFIHLKSLKSTRFPIIRNLILNLLHHSYTDMVYRSKVQTIVLPVKLQKCLKLTGLLVGSGYLYRSDHKICTPVQKMCLILRIFN